MAKANKTQRQGFRKQFRKQVKKYHTRQRGIIGLNKHREELVEQLKEIAEIRLMRKHWSVRWLHRLSFWFWKEVAKTRSSFRAAGMQIRKGRS